MRASTVVLCSAFCLSMAGRRTPAQVFVGGNANSQITVTNGVAVGSNPQAQINAQSVRPNLAASNATPAIGRSGIRPAIPGTNSAALSGPNPKTGFTTAIGQQGSGTAIGQQGSGTAIGQQGSGTAINPQSSGTVLGQQGSGTAIGQQGSGTAIGQQGVGTAITPPNNGVVIGQPEPFSPSPASPPAGGVPPANGLTNSVAPGFGNRGVTNGAAIGVGARPASTPPVPAISPGSTPPPRRR